jgi:hypothetical protein
MPCWRPGRGCVHQLAGGIRPVAVTCPSFKARAYASPKPSYDASSTAAHDAWHLRVLVLVTTFGPAPGAATAPCPGKPWPTTGPTGKSGCCPRSVFPQPTRPGTSGNPSRPPTRTTWSIPGGCCTPSLTAPDGKLHSMRPDEELRGATAQIFRQPGEQHDGTTQGTASRSLAYDAGSRPDVSGPASV